MMSLMISYAGSQLGKPYIFGSNGGDSYDCSGFVLECLESVGLIGRQDRTAQGIYNYFIAKYPPNKSPANPEPGDLVFYGKETDKIKHIAIVYSYVKNGELFYPVIIEAGGGDRRTVNFEEARKQGAQVRLRPMMHRQDIVAILDPRGIR